MPFFLKVSLRTVLALAGAVLVLALVSSIAAWLPPLLGLQGSATAQLAGDLASTVMAGVLSIAFATRYAPLRPRTHGTLIWLLVALGSGWAAWTMGGEFPRWFVMGLLLSLPLQLAVGLWLGTRHTRTATQV